MTDDYLLSFGFRALAASATEVSLCRITTYQSKYSIMTVRDGFVVNGIQLKTPACFIVYSIFIEHVEIGINILILRADKKSQGKCPLS